MFIIVVCGLGAKRDPGVLTLGANSPVFCGFELNIEVGGLFPAGFGLKLRPGAPEFAKSELAGAGWEIPIVAGFEGLENNDPVVFDISPVL